MYGLHTVQCQWEGGGNRKDVKYAKTAAGGWSEVETDGLGILLRQWQVGSLFRRAGGWDLGLACARARIKRWGWDGRTAKKKLRNRERRRIAEGY